MFKGQSVRNVPQTTCPRVVLKPARCMKQHEHMAQSRRTCLTALFGSTLCFPGAHAQPLQYYHNTEPRDLDFSPSWVVFMIPPVFRIHDFASVTMAMTSWPSTATDFPHGPWPTGQTPPSASPCLCPGLGMDRNITAPGPWREVHVLPYTALYKLRVLPITQALRRMPHRYCRAPKSSNNVQLPFLEIAYQL